MKCRSLTTLCVVVTGAVLSAACIAQESQQTPVRSRAAEPAHQLPLLPAGQHLGYIEGFNPDNPPPLREAMDRAFEAALKGGMRVGRIQMDWTDLEPTKGVYHKDELAERLQFYHSRGLAIFLLLCTADTDALNYPKDLLAEDGEGLANAMAPDDPTVVKRYCEMLDWVIPVARKNGVYCISVGNEPDTHHERDPRFMPHFIKFVAAVRNHAHGLDPEIAITYTSTCDPATHPERGYGSDMAGAVDIVCFNFYALGNTRGLDLEATEETLNKMLALSKGKPVQIQELGCSSLCNPDMTWQFHKSTPELQRDFFAWVFKTIKSRTQIRAAFIFQLVEHSPSIDKLYAKAFGAEMPAAWTRSFCDWLKGLGLIRFDDARHQPAWDEFLKGLQLIYRTQG